MSTFEDKQSNLFKQHTWADHDSYTCVHLFILLSVINTLPIPKMGLRWVGLLEVAQCTVFMVFEAKHS